MLDLETEVSALKCKLDASVAAQLQLSADCKAAQKTAAKAVAASEKALAQLQILLPAFQQRVAPLASPPQMAFSSPLQQQVVEHGVQPSPTTMDRAFLVDMFKSAFHELQSGASRGHQPHGGFVTPQSTGGLRQPRHFGQGQAPPSAGFWSSYESEHQPSENQPSRDQQLSPLRPASNSDRNFTATSQRQVFGRGTGSITPRQPIPTVSSSQTRSRSHYMEESAPCGESQHQRGGFDG